MPRIGPILLDAPICQAGLAGYSDRAMRVVARRRGCPYAVTEALLDVILVAGGQGLRRSIDIADDDHPVAGQVIGSDPAVMAAAAGILGRSGYDVVDLNFACPVKKIRNKARGGHMLRDIPRGLAILAAARDAVPDHIPMTVSLRHKFGAPDDPDDALAALLDAAFANGYSAARVHARTVEQKYLGRADWSVLADLKRRHPHHTLLGSGDLFTPHDVVRMLTQTAIDIAWIARGAIGNPWIFTHVRQLLAGAPPDSLTAPTIHEQRAALAEHFDLALQIHGEQLAGRRMRKMGIKYARFHPAAADVKRRFIEVSTLREWTAVLDLHYTTDAPGVWPADNAADEVNPSCEPVTAAD